MNPQNIFHNNLNEHLELFGKLYLLNDSISCAADMAICSLRSKGKIMLCGNGGSAADSQHIAAELTGRFINDRAPLAALALSTDTSAITCIGNDYSFNDIFERQVRGLGHPGDCLVAISTSGNSENVLRAVRTAKSMCISTIGLLGRDGGKLRDVCDHSILVPSYTTARIQEAHILIGHTICGLIEAGLGFA